MTDAATKAARAAILFRKHKQEIEAFFDRAQERVYTPLQLEEVILSCRREWHLGAVSASAILELLLGETLLSTVDLKSDQYPGQQRFAWGQPSPFELALSLKPNSYLSHGTAAHLRGLLPETPTTIYINKEQSPKPQVGNLNQDALNRAFSSRPRQSNLVFCDGGGNRFVVVAGKFTKRLEVNEIKGAARIRLPVTKTERTLIDIAVRPIYCGGVQRVLEAYRAARGVFSMDRLMATLKKLGHLYPYHQAIGFYLERAGYSGDALDVARRPGLAFDFYLTHGIEDREYSKEWRLYYPRGL